jgi:hypothetical protein
VPRGREPCTHSRLHGMTTQKAVGVHKYVEHPFNATGLWFRLFVSEHGIAYSLSTFGTW